MNTNEPTNTATCPKCGTQSQIKPVSEALMHVCPSTDCHHRCEVEREKYHILVPDERRPDHFECYVCEHYFVSWENVEDCSDCFTLWCDKFNREYDDIAAKRTWEIRQKANIRYFNLPARPADTNEGSEDAWRIAAYEAIKEKVAEKFEDPGPPAVVANYVRNIISECLDNREIVHAFHGLALRLTGKEWEFGRDPFALLNKITTINDRLQAELTEAKKRGEWVSVDQPPSESGRYEVSIIRYSDGLPDVDIAMYRADVPSWSCTLVRSDTVTAYRPLSSPYLPDAEDGNENG